MRIGFNFHTVDEYISGVEYYTLGLLNGLLSIDDNNQYLVFTNRPDVLKHYVAQKENLLVKDLSILKTRTQRILWEHCRLPKQAKKEKLDILHCPGYICPVFRTYLPYTVTIHDTIAIDHPRWCKRTNAAYYNVVMKVAAKKAAKIIAVSKSTAENVCHNFKVNESKVKVIYPGIEATFIDQPDFQRLDNVRLKYGLPPKYILFVGNIEPKKNILNLLRAFNLLRQKGIEHKLVLVGKRTWKSQEVWNYIQFNFDSKHITLTGYVDRKDLPFVYKMADVFVFASLCEGFGFPAIEAMACGTAVVASSTGILKETDEKAYGRIDPYDPGQIAETIYSLITDDKLKNTQIKSGLKVSKKFNWQDCARRTLSLYREAVESYG